MGRFGTIDRFSEKYYDMTPYQYGALNPIKYIDVNGDSLLISHKGQDYLYQSGKLYQNGSEYTGKVKGFLKQTVNALGKISAGKEGSAMISELEGSKNNFTIVKSSSNSFVPDNTPASFANIPEIQAASGNSTSSLGSGGTINFNPSSGTSGLNTASNINRPSYIGLAHEMFHGRDSNQGVLYYGQNYTGATTGITYQSTYQGLLKAEWRAVYYENTVRGQSGLPLRTHYGIQQTPNGPLPTGPRLLDVNNKPINYQVR